MGVKKERMNKIEEIFSMAKSGEDYAKRYVSYLSELLQDIDFKAIEKVIEVFQNARANGKTIFFAGNGGSAATCSHFAEDLALGTFIAGKTPFKALSLTDNVAYVTAMGNDEGYENIFVGQMRNLFTTGDVLVGISASGNSPNVIKAIEYANDNGGISIGLLGFDGGKMKEICRHCIHINTMKGEYGPVEDIHLILGHIISTYLKYRL
jgi:D-sedoheptulose 7-phosphate isomerase